MLKKLLPELKSQIQNQIKSKRNLLRPNKSADFNINLLDPLTVKQEEQKASSKLIPIANVAVFLVFIIFLSFYILNMYFDQELSRLKSDRDGLLSFIDSKQNLEKKIATTSELINIYKTRKTSARFISEDTDKIITMIDKHVILKSLNYEGSKMLYEFFFSSDEVIKYAYLINDLLSYQNIDSIALKDVSYVSSDDSYTASFEIKLK